MATETEIVAEMKKSLAKEIAILRTRYQRIVTLYYLSGYYRVKDVTGEELFYHTDPMELERFICQAVN